MPSGYDSMLALQDKKEYSVTFTHADLSFRNILYQDGKITGIVDWEFADWYPEYWEFPVTWDSFWDSPDLGSRITDFLDPFS